MNIWFLLVLVAGTLYVLDRLTSTTDLPVSARLARARELIERGRVRPAPSESPAPAVDAPAPANADSTGGDGASRGTSP